MSYALIAVAIVVALGWFTFRARHDERILLAPALPAPNEPEHRVERDPRLDDILSSFDLTDRETEFFGKWSECRVDGVRVAFQGNADELTIEVGDFDPDEEQLSDIYLSSTRADRPKPETAERQLDPFLGPAGRAVADRYYLNATGNDDYPQLKVPAVQAALQQLSDTVDEVAFYESGGFSVRCLCVTRRSAESDARHAVAIVKALG